MFDDKKGASMGSWAEGMIASIVIVLCVGIIITDYNFRYSKNYNLGFETPVLNSTAEKFLVYGNTSQSQLSGGEVNFNSASGLTLLTSWSLVMNFFSITWSFLMGDWIRTIIVGDPAIGGGIISGPAGMVLAIFLQGLYIFSLVAIALYLLFRVQP